MKHPSNFLAAVVAFLSLTLGLTVPQQARATIVIYEGSLEVAHTGGGLGGTVSIASDSRGFSLLGGCSLGGCLLPSGPSGAHQPIGLNAAMGGSDFGGSFMLDGKNYRMGVVNWLDDPAYLGDALFYFNAPILEAPAFGPLTATFTFPFTFTGFLHTVSKPHGIPETEDLTGAGIVTVALVDTGYQGPIHVWELSGASYDFQTPEPGTLLLLGSGLAGLGGIAWRRRRASPTVFR